MRTFICSLLLLISLGSKSQLIHEIDYTVLPYVSNCNVFANPTVVGGLTHLTTFGLPSVGKYCDPNESQVILNFSGVFTSVSGVPKLETEGYSIAYNFQKDYQYEISAFARLEMIGAGNSLVGNLAMAITSDNGGNNSTCLSPFQDASVMSRYSVSFMENYRCDINDFEWFTPINKTLTENASYLLVAGFPYSNYNGMSISVRRLRIKESPVLKPAAVNISCGQQVPITFTIGNGTDPGVTEYKWNLGAAPNGWLLPNGQPAPAIYSTGLSNSLTLTPVCGSLPKNVSGSITKNGTNVNAFNTAAVTASQPSYSINAPSSIYYNGSVAIGINNLPCNASVAWSVSAPNIVSLSCTNCISPSISRITDGTVTLTAVVTACGTTQTLTKQITVCLTPSGTCTNLIATLYWPSSYYYGYYIYFDGVPNASNYTLEWYDITDSRTAMISSIYGSGEFIYTFESGHTYKYRVAPVYSCGVGTFSDWSAPLLPPPASCANGPISTTLAQTLGCGGASGCTSTNVSWPAITGASQYKVNYSIEKVSAGIVGASGTITVASPNAVINFPPLSGTGWTMVYRVSANCGGTFGNFSGFSPRFFIQ